MSASDHTRRWFSDLFRKRTPRLRKRTRGTIFTQEPSPDRTQEGGSSSWPESIHYQRKLAGRDLNKSSCMASCGSWLLMVDHRYDIHLLNVITFGRINLPTMKLKPKHDGINYFDCGSIPSKNLSRDDLQWKNTAVLWINDTSGDYFVAWIFRQNLFSHMKGDHSWWSVDIKCKGASFMDAAYRNRKLYMLTADKHIKIFDFSRNIELDTCKYHPFRFDEKPWEYIWKTKLAIEESGEVLIVLSIKNVKKDQEKLLFYVFKMNFESCMWERVYSIGDNEMLIFGQGVTVKAPVRDLGHGIKSGSINFVKDDVGLDHDAHGSVCGVFDLATSRIEWPEKTCYYITRTQWYVPGVAY